MMIDKKGHKCRNIQEQVGKNTCDIQKLKERMPVTDFVIHASINDDNGKHLTLRQRVDDEVEEVSFKGGKDLIAGPNINITETDTSATISATTEPVGSVSFENIVGDAMDNDNLKGYLDKKQVKLTAGSNITITELPNTAVISANFEPLTDVVTLTTGQNITGFKTFVNDNGISIGGSATPINRRTFVKTSEIIFYTGSTENHLFFAEIANHQYVTNYVASAITGKQDKATLGDDVEALGFIRETDHYIVSQSVTNHVLNWRYNDGITGSVTIPDKTSQLDNDADFAYSDEVPSVFIKSQEVSGNTLTWTNADGSTGSFTPSGSGGITDVKVNGTSVVTSGVANITIPEDAQFVYDMTLNLQTGSVTINNPNYYSRIVQYHTDNDKWPVIYGTVHISGQPDIIVLIRSIVDNGTSLTLTGTYDQYGDSISFDVIEVAITASSQIAVFTQKEIAQKSDIPTVPTKTSDLVNDSGFITESDIPDIPTKTSDLVNDSGFISTPRELFDLIEGSDFISVDLNPTDDKLQISFDFTNLDQFITFPTTQSEVVLSWTSDNPAKLQATLNQTVRNKINNSLQLPTTHTEETLVGVDTTGGQEQVKIGSGLSIVNGALTATAQEVHLYEHNINIISSDINLSLKLINNSSTQISSIEEIVSTYETNTIIIGNGWYIINSKYHPIVKIEIIQINTQIGITYINDGGTVSVISIDNLSANDTIRQII